MSRASSTGILGSFGYFSCSVSKALGPPALASASSSGRANGPSLAGFFRVGGLAVEPLGEAGLSPPASASSLSPPDDNAATRPSTSSSTKAAAPPNSTRDGTRASFASSGAGNLARQA